MFWCVVSFAWLFMIYASFDENFWINSKTRHFYDLTNFRLKHICYEIFLDITLEIVLKRILRKSISRENLKIAKINTKNQFFEILVSKFYIKRSSPKSIYVWRCYLLI